ncbi:MAG: nucleotide-binding protein [Candidatus Thiodiazotropha taylori]
MNVLADKLNELIEYAWNCKNHEIYNKWMTRAEQILSAAYNQEVSREFMSLRNSSFQEDRPRQIGYLEGLLLKTADESSAPVNTTLSSKDNADNIRKSNKVFIVHGHDSAVKESVARYVEKIGLDPIILHEQPNGGKTIIEKFEVYSDVGFAIVLLTPDDFGGPKDNKDSPSLRARQNVIMELGYFIGKLGRNRVCALYKTGVEMPSDYQGVIYTELDGADGWKMKLAQELNECGFPLNIGAILGK